MATWAHSTVWRRQKDWLQLELCLCRSVQLWMKIRLLTRHGSTCLKSQHLGRWGRRTKARLWYIVKTLFQNKNKQIIIMSGWFWFLHETLGLILRTQHLYPSLPPLSTHTQGLFLHFILQQNRAESQHCVMGCNVYLYVHRILMHAFMKTYMYVNLMLAETVLLTTDYSSVRSKTGLSGTSPWPSCRIEWLRAACKHFLPHTAERCYLPASWTHMIYKCIPCITACWPFLCV